MDRLPDDELISAYLDDELSSDERAYVERLLTERPEARRLLDECRAVRESLQGLPSYKLEPDFGSQVLQRAEREVLRAPTVTRIVEDGDGIADRSIIDAWHKERRWRRPLMWTIVAVAAALVLMFVDQRGDRERHLAVNDPVAAPRELGRDTNVDIGDKQQPEGERLGLEEGDRRDVDRAPVFSKFGPALADGPAADAERATANGLRGTALPATPTTMPKGVAPAGAGGGGSFAVQNTMPTAPADAYFVQDKAAAGATIFNNLNRGTPATPAEGLSAVQSLNAQIDTTPLVADNDYERAKSLATDYNDVRRNNSDEQAAYRALNTRLQSRQMGIAGVGQQAAPNESPLIVVCDVTPEAVERGLVPILQGQQIADLSAVRSSLTSETVGAYGGGGRMNAAANPEPGKKIEQNAAPVQEEYVYVVADSRQLEATLDALRRQPEYFLNVNVEPSPNSQVQQQWRTYNRGLQQDASQPLPTTIASPVTSAAIAGATATPSLMPSSATPSPVSRSPSPAAPQMSKSSSVPAGAPAASAPLAPGGPAPPTAVPANDPKVVAAPKSVEGITSGSLKSFDKKDEPVSPSVPSVAQQPAGNDVGSLGWLEQQTALGRNSYAFTGNNSNTFSRAQRFNSVELNALPAERDVAAQRKAGDIASAKQQAAPAANTPAASLPAVAPANETAPPAGGKLKDETTVKELAERRRDTVGATQQQVDASSSAGLPLPGTLGSELPPDYHEALFIFRVASSPAQQTLGGTAAGEAKPAATAKPPASKAD